MRDKREGKFSFGHKLATNAGLCKKGPYIREKGELNGLMIYAKSFPGWNDFAAFLSHIKFIKNHHQKVKKIAAVTGSSFLSIMPQVQSFYTGGSKTL